MRDEAGACGGFGGGCGETGANGGGGGENDGSRAVKSITSSPCPGVKNAGSSKTKSGSGAGGLEVARKVGGESSEATRTR